LLPPPHGGQLPPLTDYKPAHLQATSLPRERVKEFQSEAQRHQPNAAPLPTRYPGTSGVTGYGAVPPMPSPAYNNPPYPPARTGIPTHMDQMNSGVHNMSIKEESVYTRGGGVPMDNNGQLIRSNSFH